VSPDLLAAIGAFLSGVASAVTAWLAIRYERRRGLEDCERRLAAFREGLDR